MNAPSIRHALVKWIAARARLRALMERHPHPDLPGLDQALPRLLSAPAGAFPGGLREAALEVERRRSAVPWPLPTHPTRKVDLMSSAQRLQQATDLLHSLNRFNDEALAAMPVIARAKERAMVQFVLAARAYVAETPPKPEAQMRATIQQTIADLEKQAHYKEDP